MKLVVLALFLATAIDATSINCYQTQTDGTVVDKACEADDVTQCQGYVSNMHTTCTHHAN